MAVVTALILLRKQRLPLPIPNKNGNISAGMSRVMFLGVLHAGLQTTAFGQIVVKTVPTALQPVPVVNMMMNLGFCVKASKIKDFEGVPLAKGVLPPPTKLLAANDVAA